MIIAITPEIRQILNKYLGPEVPERGANRKIVYALYRKAAAETDSAPTSPTNQTS